MSSAAEVAGSIGGALVGGAIGAWQGGKNRKHDREMQARQFDYGREMFGRQIDLQNTAVQRQMADLKAAGVNPMLAASLGGAQSPAAPGGAAGTSQGDSMVQGAQMGAATALEMKRLKKEIQVAEEQKRNLVATTAESNSRTYQSDQAARKFQEEIELLRLQKPALAAEATARQAEARYNVRDADHRLKYYLLDKNLDRVSKGSSAVGNILGRGKMLDALGSSAKHRKPVPTVRPGPFRR